jgi:uroporphyrinogen decarboxylase
MPILLNLQRYVQPKLADMGESINIVSTRGPLTIASHLMALSELLVCLKVDPDATHKLLKLTTKLCKDWLTAQLENVKTAAGILVLDDVTGFLGKEDYEEFAHPYLKEIFTAFPECVHLFHNDTHNNTCFPYLADMGVELFNFSHKTGIAEARRLAGGKVSLLGNVPPMSTAEGTPDTVYRLAAETIAQFRAENGGGTQGLILSLGGGVPMGAKRENLEALVRAAAQA